MSSFPDLRRALPLTIGTNQITVVAHWTRICSDTAATTTRIQADRRSKVYPPWRGRR